MLLSVFLEGNEKKFDWGVTTAGKQPHLQLNHLGRTKMYLLS